MMECVVISLLETPCVLNYIRLYINICLLLYEKYLTVPLFLFFSGAVV